MSENVTASVPNLAGVDFSQYQAWQVIRTPRGGVYYKVPGTSYVYDPFASAARGRTVLYLDPTPELDERQRAQDLQDRQISLAERQGSPEGQLLPILGGTAGTVGGAMLINSLASGGAAAPVAAVPAAVAPAVAAAPGAAAVTGAALPAAAEGSAALTGAALATPAPVLPGAEVAASAVPSTGFLGTGLGLGLAGAGVAAYYGPSYYKYGERLLSGDANQDDQFKAAMLTNPVTAWAVPIADLAGIKWKAGKHQDQVQRDQVRDFAQERGLIDGDYNLTLADGSKFDIGKDGSTRAYNIDPEKFKDPVIANTIGLVNPLAAIMGSGSDKLTSDFGGYFTNAVTSNAKDPNAIMANVRAQYQNAGLDQASALQTIAQLEKDGKIDASRAAAYRNGINQVFVAPEATAPAARTTPPAPAATKGAGVVAGPVQPIPAQPPIEIRPTTPPRSSTSSPGVDLNGQKIDYAKADRLGRALAGRMNGGR